MLTRWDLNELRHEDDELMHYGVKGMRWGKHLPGIDAVNAAIAKARVVTDPMVRATLGPPNFNSVGAAASGVAKGLKKIQDANTKKIMADKAARASRERQIAYDQRYTNKGVTGSISLNAHRRDYERSVRGRIDKFASNTLKDLRYNVGKAKKRVSGIISKFTDRIIKNPLPAGTKIKMKW